MKRSTLAIMLGVLGLLLVAAIVMRRAQRPEKPLETLLTSVAVDEIVQMDLAVSGATTTLKVVEGEWRIVAPFEDRAFTDAVSRLLNVMKDIRLSSVLSENPARHAQYELDDARATRLQVFVRGKETPALDYLVGKETIDGRSAYVRLPGARDVRTAEGLAASLLLRSPEMFRSPLVLAFDGVDLTGLSTQGAIEVSVVRSSRTWVNEKSQRILPSNVYQDLSTALRAWRSETFVVIAPSGQGFEKPYLTIEAKKGPTSLTVTVGGPVPGTEHPARYVRSSDRPAVLVVEDTRTQAVIDQLKKTR